MSDKKMIKNNKKNIRLYIDLIRKGWVDDEIDKI
jgi:hypothetical protein